MKSTQTTVGIIIFAAICVILGYGAGLTFAFDGEIEIYKNNLATIEEYQYVKSIVPSRYRKYFDGYIAAVASGKDCYYNMHGWLDDTDNLGFVAATLSTPGGKTFRLVRDYSENHVQFVLDNNYKSYFSISELSKDFPPGQYTLRITLANHSVITAKTTLPNLDSDSFADFVDGYIDADPNGTLQLHWSTVPDVEEYEVYAVKLKTFDYFYESDNIYVTPPQTLDTTLTDAIAGTNDYSVEIVAEKDASSDYFRFELNSYRGWYVFQNPMFNYDLSGEYWFGSLSADADTWEPWAKSGSVIIDGNNWNQQWYDYDGFHSFSDTFTTTPQVDHSLNINLSDGPYNVAWNGNMIIHADALPNYDNLLGTDIMMRKATNVDVNDFIGNYSFFGHWLGWDSRWAEVQWGNVRFDANGTVVQTSISSKGNSDTFTSTWTLDAVNGVVDVVGTSHPAFLCKNGILVVFQNIDPDSLGYDIFVKKTDASPTPADISGTYLVRFLETSVDGQPFTCYQGTCIIKPDGTFHVDAWYRYTPAGFHDVFDAKYTIGPGNRIQLGDNAEGIVSPDLGLIFAPEYDVPASPTEDDWIGGIFLVRVAANAPSSPSPEVTACTVTAGKDNLDKISISGLMDATTRDILPADSIKVTICSEDLVSPCVQTFPINGKTFKKGKFSYTGVENGIGKFFTYDVKTHKFSFSAKNVDLTGLWCPVSVEIEIGDYNAEMTVDETIANGKTKSLPIQLMMGVKNILQVDSFKVKFGKTDGTDSLTIKGVFTVKDTINKANPFIASLGKHTFTVEGINFTKKGDVESCKATSNEGANVVALFDFAKCTFSVVVTNANITDYGLVDFDVDIFGIPVSNPVQLDLGPQRVFGLEELRMYDSIGSQWTYNADYSYTAKMPGGNTKNSGSATANINIGDAIFNYISCYEVAVSVPGSDIDPTYTYWYSDTDGIHWAGSKYGSSDFSSTIMSDVVMPSSVAIGRTYNSSGPFVGDIQLNVNQYLPICESGICINSMDFTFSNFQGDASHSIKLLGNEEITVPYSPDVFNAVKGTDNQIVKGTLNYSVDISSNYGDVSFYGTGKFTGTCTQTFWAVPGLGFVAVDSKITVKLSMSRIGTVSMTVTENDSLTDYSD